MYAPRLVVDKFRESIDVCPDELLQSTVVEYLSHYLMLSAQ